MWRSFRSISPDWNGGDESRPARSAPLHVGAAEYLRFQRLIIIWQHRPAETLAADEIGDGLGADACRYKLRIARFRLAAESSLAPRRPSPIEL